MLTFASSLASMYRSHTGWLKVGVHLQRFNISDKGSMVISINDLEALRTSLFY